MTLKNKLISLCIGASALTTPFIASCGNNVNSYTIDWNEGEVFEPTISPKDFASGEGTFTDNNALTTAYHDDLIKQPLVVGEDWVKTKSQGEEMEALNFTLRDVSELKTHYTHPWNITYFSLSFKIIITGIYQNCKLENKKFEFTNFPIHLEGYQYQNPHILPLTEFYTTSDCWSIYMPEIYLVGQDEVHFTSRYKLYNMDVLKDAGSFLQTKLAEIITDLTSFSSNYYMNAKV